MSEKLMNTRPAIIATTVILWSIACAVVGAGHLLEGLWYFAMSITVFYFGREEVR